MTRNLKKHNNLKPLASTVCLASLLLYGCGGGSNNSDSNSVTPDTEQKVFSVQIGNDKNSKTNPLLSLNPGGPGGSSNQSLRAGDILIGDDQDDLLIGGLGVDILLGGSGDDILIGGTEDFNSSVDGDETGSDNRDKAFGQGGNDVFIWAPGDGSDFFDGGDGIDVVILGILGEKQDVTGGTVGAPFFNVNPSGEGSLDFDGIFVNDDGQPQVRVSNTPGFCGLVDSNEFAYELAELSLDQVVRFTIRGIANDFDSGERSDDDGLRVAISLKNTEYVVCTRREFEEEQTLDNINVLDISSGMPVSSSINDLPEYVQKLIF